MSTPSSSTSDTRTFDLSIPSGATQSARVPIKTFGKLTKLMSLAVSAGGVSSDTGLTFITWELGGTGDGLVVLASETMSDGAFTLMVNADGGVFGANVMAPLAGEIDKDWQLKLSSAATADLKIILRVI
ncbi:hypothetical protein U2F10_02760 [Leptothoe sp. EHU-05/26/07-4]